jgi:hypothetical protein
MLLITENVYAHVSLTVVLWLQTKPAPRSLVPAGSLHTAVCIMDYLDSCFHKRLQLLWVPNMAGTACCLVTLGFQRCHSLVYTLLLPVGCQRKIQSATTDKSLLCLHDVGPVHLEHRKTAAPSSASRSAMAFPIPAVAAVIRTVFPSKRLHLLPPALLPSILVRCAGRKSCSADDQSPRSKGFRVSEEAGLQEKVTPHHLWSV